MYPSYPNDPKVQLQDTCARAIEGQQYHSRIQAGSFSVVCTANVLATVDVTFAQKFTTTEPTVLHSVKAIGDSASTVKFADITARNDSSFTLRVLTDTTQTIDFEYIALGTAE